MLEKKPIRPEISCKKVKQSNQQDIRRGLFSPKPIYAPVEAIKTKVMVKKRLPEFSSV
jgi:hypothetical protein